MPRISVITVNYNNAPGLRRTIDSVLNQSFTDYEYLIIDGGSTDDSRTLIGQHEERLAWWVSEKDGGIYHAMNKGIKKASGDYVMLLNSGDYLLHGDVLADFDEHTARKHALIYYGDINLEGANGGITQHCYPAALSLDFLENYTINHQACFINRMLFDEFGLYNVSYLLAADYAFFLKCFVHGKVFEHINKPLVQYSLDGASSLQRPTYAMEMQRAWSETVPPFLIKLHNDDKAHRSLMKHRMFSLAEVFQRNYNRLKQIFK